MLKVCLYDYLVHKHINRFAVLLVIFPYSLPVISAIWSTVM